VLGFGAPNLAASNRAGIEFFHCPWSLQSIVQFMFDACSMRGQKKTCRSGC
jgi:hypothetical protein